MGSQQIYLLYLFLLVVVEGSISFGKEKQKQIKSKCIDIREMKAIDYI